MDTGEGKKRRGRKRKRSIEEEKNAALEKSGAKLISLIGKYVKKEFDGYGVYLGKVVSYSEGLYRVVYEDGDSEDLDSDEISPILAEEKGFNADFKRRKKRLDQMVSMDEGKGDQKKGSEMVSKDEVKQGKNKGSERKEKVHVGKGDGSAARKVPEQEIEEQKPEVLADGDVEGDSSSDSSEVVKVSVVETPLPPPLVLPESSGTIGVAEECVSLLFSVYSFLRSFSIQLFISPFRLDDFVGALNCGSSNTLMDQIHFSLLRALDRDFEMLSSDGSRSASKCMRRLDWNLLDTLTWTVYLVEYLLVMGYANRPEWKGFFTDVLEGEYYRLSVARKLMVLQILCDDVLDSRELRAEVDMRADLEEGIDCSGTANLPPEIGQRRVHPRYSKTSSCKDLQVADMSKAHNSKTSHYISTMGTDATSVGHDGNSDECRLCGMDGHLVCCDGCPSAYHPRCIGTTKLSIPDGIWFCPECTSSKTEPTLIIAAGLRGAELFGIDPYEQMFVGICHHLLVIDASVSAVRTSRYYNQRDIPQVLKVLCSSVQHKASYTGICKGIMQYWDIVEDMIEDTKLLLPETSEAGINPVADGKEGTTPSVPGGDLSSKETTKRENEASVITESVVENAMLSHQENPHQEYQLKNTSLETVDQVKDPGREINAGVTYHRVSATNSKAFKQIGAEPTISLGSANHCREQSDLTEQSLARKSIELGFSAHTVRDKCTTVIKSAGGMPFLSPTLNMSRERTERNDNFGRKSKCDKKNDFLYFGTSFKPYAYTNQYFLGDLAASAAANLFVLVSEEKGVAGADDSSKRRKIISENAALQVKAFSSASVNFFWPNSEKKLMEIPRERCGWCLSCKAPVTSRKGCLLNFAATNALKASARVIIGPRPIKNGEGSIPSIITYILYMEESLQGLVVGPFLSENYRKQWRKRVETASTCSALKFLLLKFEEHIRLVAFSSGWLKLVDDWSVEYSSVQNSSCSVAPTSKRPGGKRNKKQAATSEIATDTCDSNSVTIKWWRGGKLLKLVFQRGMLPISILRKASRQGGSQKVSSIHYGEGSEISRRSKQIAWRVAVEVSQNAQQLALQVRMLDLHLRWSDLVPPEQNSHDKGQETETTAFRNGVISDKKIHDNNVIYGLEFGGQKHFSSRVMKNIIQLEQKEDGTGKFWFSETHIPLFLIKEYEKKADKDILAPDEAFQALSRLQRRQHSSWYLNYKGEGKGQCVCCQRDVLHKDAVKCNQCEGSCHKDCTRSSFGRTKEEVDLITCKRCYIEPPVSDLFQRSQGAGTKDAESNGSHQSLSSILWDTDSPLPGSNLASRRKSGTVPTYGIIWKKKQDEDTGINFRLKNILLSGNANMDPSRCPNCYLCNKPYNSHLMYIHCEECNSWYHADAIQLKESQVFDVLGFRCCRCRKKPSPICPYSDQEGRKPRSRPPKQSKNRGVEPGSATMITQPIGRETATPVPLTKMEDVAVEDDDPLLFSLERVEVISNPTQDLLSGWDAGGASFHGPQKLPVRRNANYDKDPDALVNPPHEESIPWDEKMLLPDNFQLDGSGASFQSPQKLPVRRYSKHDQNVDGDALSNAPIAESTSDDASMPVNNQKASTSMVNSELSIPDLMDEAFDFDAVNCDTMHFEPQTYFWVKELLPDCRELQPEDSQSYVYDPMSDELNTCDHSYDSNLAYNFLEQERVDAPDGPQDIPGPSNVEPVRKVQCHMCTYTDPAPDLCCANCGMWIHKHCSPWTEQTRVGAWNCGNCREWR